MVEEKDKKDEKPKKPIKWIDIKKKLKETGALPRNYIDRAKIEIPLPTFSESVTERQVKCGCFTWDFKFYNKQMHGDAQAVLDKEEDDGDDEEGPPFLNPFQGNRLPPIRSRAIARAVRQRQRQQQNAIPKCQGEGRQERRQLNANRLRKERKRNLTHRQGYVLQAHCKPNLEVDGQSNAPSQPLQEKDFRFWRTVAVFKTTWLGTARAQRLENKIFVRSRKSFIFTKKHSTNVIRHYGPTALAKKRTLVIHMWVVRITKVKIVPKLTFDKADDRVCLRAGDENIFVHREALGIHSAVLRAILEDRKGERIDERNPIVIDERFSPTLVRLAFRALFANKKIDCLSVRELLDFGTHYKIGNLLGLLEESLIFRRKCQHFDNARKLQLAYEFGLHELINTFAHNLKTMKEIETRLDNADIHEKFKQQLQRKLVAMQKEEEELKRLKNEEQMKKREARRNKRLKKKERKAKKKVEDHQRKNTAKMTTLRISGPTTSKGTS